MIILSPGDPMPDPSFANEEGLLAIGGDLHPQRLLDAYRKGIFPWYGSDDPIAWWCPDPRFILLPGELIVSKSMQKLFRQHAFSVTVNKAFADVIHACRTIRRKEGYGTWIHDEIESVYTDLHDMGYAFSVEAWQSGKLAGGFYGIRMGDVFYGESMFSYISNASKYAFIDFVVKEREMGLALIDCQVYSSHLESLGANMIRRDDFLQALQKLIGH